MLKTLPKSKRQLLKTLNMSTEKKDLKVTPLQENEAGQIEGGFAELAADSPAESGLNIGCPTNAIACKPSSTAPAQ